MKTKKINKNQKPIDFDIHLKYVCKKCGQFHWLSFKETSTKDFKIVCDCNNIFMVKRTKQFLLRYAITKSKTKMKKQIPKETLQKAISVFVNYGFTEKEAGELLSESYEKNATDNASYLVKQTLELLKDKNVNKCNASI